MKNPLLRGIGALFLSLSLALPSPAGAGPELSRGTLRPAGLEEQNPAARQEILKTFGESVSAGMEEAEIRLDPNWEIRSVPKAAFFSQEQIGQLKAALKEILFYGSGIRLRRVVVARETGRDLIGVSASEGTLRIGTGAWASPELLRFTLHRGLSLLRMEQLLADLAIDMGKQNLRKRYQTSDPEYPGHIAHLASAQAYSATVDPAIRDLALWVLWADFFGRLVTAPRRQVVLSQLTDRDLAGFLEQAQSRPWEEQLLLAAAHFQSRGVRFPWLLPVGESNPEFLQAPALLPERYRTLFDQASRSGGIPVVKDWKRFQRGIAQRNPGDQAESLRTIEVLSRADPQFFPLIRSWDLILQATIELNRLLSFDPEFPGRLAGLVEAGPETMEGFRRLYGAEFFRGLSRLSRSPGVLRLLEVLGPETARGLLAERFFELANWPESPAQEADRIINFCETLKKGWIRDLARRSPGRLADVLVVVEESYLFEKSPDLESLPDFAQALKEWMGEERYQEVLDREPSRLLDLVAVCLGKHYSGLPVSLPRSRREVEAWLAPLLSSWGADLAKQIQEKDPLTLLDLGFLVSRRALTPDDLDRLQADYGREGLGDLSERTGPDFVKALILLRDADPPFVERLGRPLFLGTIAERGFSGFASDWGDGWIRLNDITEKNIGLVGIDRILLPDYPDPATQEPWPAFKPLRELLEKRLPWVGDDLLRRMFAQNPRALSALARAVTLFAGRDFYDDLFNLPQNMDEDETQKWESAALRLRAEDPIWSRWEKVSRALKPAFWVQLLEEDPAATADYLAGAAQRPDENPISELIGIAGAVWGEEAPDHPEWWVRAMSLSRQAAVLNRSLSQRVDAETEGKETALAYRLGSRKAPEAVARLPEAVDLRERFRPISPQAVLQTVAEQPEGLGRAVAQVGEPMDLNRLLLASIFGRKARDHSGYFREGLSVFTKLFGWNQEDLDRRFAQDPSGLAAAGIRAGKFPADKIQEAQDRLRAWGEEGAALLREAGQDTATALLLVEALFQTGMEESAGSFIENRLLPLARQRASSAGRKGEALEARIAEARFLLRLSRQGLGVSEGEALRFWIWVLDRASLPIDRLGKSKPEERLLEEPGMEARLTEILQREPAGSELFRTAFRLMIHWPERFRAAVTRLDPSRKALLQQQAAACRLEQLFDALRYSPSNKWHLNRVAGVLLSEWIRVLGGKTKQFVFQPGEIATGRENAAELRVLQKTYREATAAVLVEKLKELGVEPDSPGAMFRQIPPGFLARLAVYALDNLNTPDELSEEFALFLQGNGDFQSYLADAILQGIREPARWRPEYRQAVRLALLSPQGSRQIERRLQQAGIKPQERLLFQADAVNAAAENHFNRIVSFHADLILTQESGKGLIPLASKIGSQSPLTVEGLRRYLGERGISVESQAVERGLDPFLYRLYHGVVLPRLNLLRRGYRGSRSFDDPQARYITRAGTVAVRYAWGGGEFAQGEGERVIHEWSFPVFSRQMALIDLEQKIVQRVYLPKVGNYFVQVQGRARLDFSRPDEPAHVIASLEIPAQEEVRTVAIPSKEEGVPVVFQIGRVDSHLYLMMIDLNVALANHFGQSPGQEAYVRQISIEGLSDLDALRRIIRMQVAERALTEELLDAAARLEQTPDAVEATWAWVTLRSVLDQMDPARVGPAGVQEKVGFEAAYFQYLFGPLQEAVRDVGTNQLTRKGVIRVKDLAAVKQRILSTPTVRFLREEEEALHGTLEGYQREFLFDPYRGPVQERRTIGNRLITVLETDTRASEPVRALYAAGDMDYFLPEMAALRGIGQGRFHQGIPAGEHTLRVLERMDDQIASRQLPAPDRRDLRLLALFHDVGKTEAHRSHAERSAGALRVFLASVQMPTRAIRRLARLVEVHQALGNLTASRVRRLAVPERAEEVQQPEFQRRENERIVQLARVLRPGIPLRQALEDLQKLYLLTIADASAIPFEGGDAGRYTTLFAQELENMRARVEQTIRNPIPTPPAAGTEETAQRRAEAALLELLPGGRQRILPIVIGAGLEAEHPGLRALDRFGELLPVEFAGNRTPREVAVDLIEREARAAVFAGTEGEAGRFIPILAAAGIESLAVTPKQGGHLLLAILAQAAGIEEATLAARAGDFLDAVYATAALEQQL